MTAITEHSVVTLHFTIKLKDGSIADSTYNLGKPAQFVIGDGNISENFEQHLIGLTTGDKRAIELAAKMHLVCRTQTIFNIWTAQSLLVTLKSKWEPLWRLVRLMVLKSLALLPRLPVILSQ